jgi:hypothetical protein
VWIFYPAQRPLDGYNKKFCVCRIPKISFCVFVVFFLFCRLADEEVEVYEGDTVKYDCPSGLTQLAGHGVEWYHNDVRVDPRQHSRIRYAKKKYVHLNFLSTKEKGDIFKRKLLKLVFLFLPGIQSP